MKQAFLSFLFVFGIVGSAAAQESATPENTITVDLSGAFGFAFRNVGQFGLAYERVVDGEHGFVVEGGYSHVHGDPMHLHLFGGRVGYRYHLDGHRWHHPFFGVLVGVQGGVGRYDDHHGVPGTQDSVALSYWGLNATAHIGYRVRLADWFVIQARVGIGYAYYSVETASTHSEAAHAVDEAHRVLANWPIAADAELSVGFAF